MLITSRNPVWGGLAKPLELNVWSPAQGAQFLESRLGALLAGANRTDLLTLADDLGGLPLALEQAASYLEQTGTAPGDYRALLTGIDTEGLILDEGRAATGYERSVAATLSLAFVKLSPAAQVLLRLCAYAAPEPLPERFFRESVEHLPPELAAAAADPLAWNGVAGELRRYGLAERTAIPALDRAAGEVAQPTEQALSFHRLTQQSIRARLARPAEDCRSFEAVLAACCPAEEELPIHWPRYAALAPHVTQLDRFYAAGWLDTRQFSWLLERVATYWRSGPALYAASARGLRRALDINSQEFGQEHPDTLATANNLAFTLWAQDDLVGVRVLQEQVLEAHRRLLGEEHRDTLASMNNLAITLRDQGDLPGARVLQEQVLVAHRRRRGEDHPATLTSMNNLAITLWKMADTDAALRLMRDAATGRARALGPQHAHTLAAQQMAEKMQAAIDQSSG
ncbi:MAG: tetratricopeptide repeat protein [Immundisolibacter sp.]